MTYGYIEWLAFLAKRYMILNHALIIGNIQVRCRASLRRLGLGKIKNELFWIFDRTKNSWYTDIQILYRQFNSVMSEEDRSISEY